MSIEIIILFFIISVIYASVGFGGGSSYLAVLTLVGMAIPMMRSISLICNIIVSLGGAYAYWKHGFLNIKKSLFITLFSVPMAFIGGSIGLKAEMFFILLGISLIVAAVFLFFENAFFSTAIFVTDKDDFHVKNRVFHAIMGIFIGFLSGLVGIGGGIFLSPLLHFTRWDNAKNIAATASFFICINSISGLAGQCLNHRFDADVVGVLPLLITVFIGGQIGNHVSISWLNLQTVRQLTAGLVMYAGINILLNYVKI